MLRSVFLRKKYLIAAGAMCSSAVGMAAEAVAAAAPISVVKTDEFERLALWMFVGVVGLLALITLMIVLRTMRMYNDMLCAAIAREQGRTLPVKAEAPAGQPSAIEKIFSKLFSGGAVPVEKEADILIAHAHDGIYELDNKLPPWWVSLFYGTIIFAFGYMGFYHFSGTDRGQLVEYEQSMRELERARYAAADRQANSVSENTVVAFSEPALLNEGKGIFLSKCAACHGQKGEGGVGPNMTDDYWLHGGGVKNIFKTITNGVPEKGMIAWGGQLRPKEIQEVASYLLTLRGTNPPNPKAPQGELYTAEKTAADSTKKG